MPKPREFSFLELVGLQTKLVLFLCGEAIGYTGVYRLFFASHLLK